ncbi:hypothetical protein [Methylocystis sp. B8]|uniref:hypothetical protein n=1 Tax=Methylocystis sp. B8 TaxID=544938 RepID=UPI0010FD2555|nr:hypothetical protein [Methylocystis sp. B8]TLG77947.1 hypothetical protein FEV16_05085 [Methylocystis sp. B8]
MALAETQALLARLFTDEDLRREFFESPIAVAPRFGLSMHETQSLVSIDRREMEAFAQSLIGKRALYARKALPLTAQALGDRFNPLLRETIRGVARDKKHRTDAAAFAALIDTRIACRRLEPPWLADLARFELAFIDAGRSGATLFFRRFDFDVASVANALARGEEVNAVRKKTFGVWVRPPRGRLRWRLLGL